LAALGRWVTLEQALGRGATGEVWLARTEQGTAYVMKLARDRAASARLIDEGERLLGINSPWCVRLLSAGRLEQGLDLTGPWGRSAFERGTPYLVFEHHPGVSIDPTAALSPMARHERALVVARDVSRALLDLHGAGVAHGDVKPGNIVLESSPNGARARLVDFGLSGAASEAVASGGTRRYIAPEALDASGTGDARLRDLYALGVTLLDLASSEPNAAVEPSSRLNQLEPGLSGLVRALLSRAPAARPAADWVQRRALELLGETESGSDALERRQSLVRRTYLSRRRRELARAVACREVEVAVEGAPGEWLRVELDLGRSLEALRGNPSSEARQIVTDLDDIGRARWLVDLVGPSGREQAQAESELEA
jgi:serine/threonine protein kinase